VHRRCQPVLTPGLHCRELRRLGCEPPRPTSLQRTRAGFSRRREVTAGVSLVPLPGPRSNLGHSGTSKRPGWKRDATDFGSKVWNLAARINHRHFCAPTGDVIGVAPDVADRFDDSRISRIGEKLVSTSRTTQQRGLTSPLPLPHHRPPKLYSTTPGSVR
jgi:hypothetical protein